MLKTNETKRDIEGTEDERGSYADISRNAVGRISIWITDARKESGSLGFVLRDDFDEELLSEAILDAGFFQRRDDGRLILTVSGVELRIEGENGRRTVAVSLNEDARARFAGFVDETAEEDEDDIETDYDEENDDE